MRLGMLKKGKCKHPVGNRNKWLLLTNEGLREKVAKFILARAHSYGIFR